MHTRCWCQLAWASELRRVGGQPVHCSKTFTMQATSAETNVASVASYLGMKVKVLTTFVKDSPIARFIKDDLASRHMDYEGKELEQGGPWGYRHQFNIADSGYGSRGPRVQNGSGWRGWTNPERQGFRFGSHLWQGGRAGHASVGADRRPFARNQHILPRTCPERRKKYGTRISFDLNHRASFWKNREKELHAIFKEITELADVVVGNEEDFQLCLGLEGPEAGGQGLGAKIDSFKVMINQAKKAFPHATVFATTLREVINTNRHLWGAILSAGDDWHIAQPQEITVLDRIGGGDGFVGGMLYAILKGWEPRKNGCNSVGLAAFSPLRLRPTTANRPTKSKFGAFGKGNARVRR